MTIMFVSQRMKKVDVFIHKKFSDNVSKEIVKFGDFQVIEISGEKAKKYLLEKTPENDFSAKLQEFERRVNFLHSTFENYSIASEIGEVDYIAEPVVINEFQIEEQIKEIETDLNDYNIKLEELRSRQNDIAIKIRKMNLFYGSNLDLTRLKDLEHFYAGFGVVPSTSYEGFISAMSIIPSTVQFIDNIGTDALILFAAPIKEKSKIEIILKNVYFKDYGLPYDLEPNGKSSLVKFAFDLSYSKDEEIWLERRFHKIFVKSIPVIHNLKYNIQYYQSMSKLKGEMVSTANVRLFSGWVPAQEVDSLKDSIEKMTFGRCIFLSMDAIDAMIQEGLIPPTKFSNPKFLKPFEGLVSTFGIPNYKEIDPTLLAAAAYVLMYGAMFGDVGHGFVLALIGLTGMLVKKFKSMKSFATVVFYVGLSSIIFGFLYGSVFGHENIFKPLWMNPSGNIMGILMVTIAFGAVIITLGTILSIINSILERNYGRLFFSTTGIAGLLLYLGLVDIGYSLISGKGFPLSGILNITIIIIILISMIAILLEKRLELLFPHKHEEGEHEEKPSMILGFVDVFETLISFISKTISFMRIGAFALNHAALMGAFFILAGMSNILPVQWLIILIGNLFVVGFEGGIVAIQSLRLEYYEFFMSYFRANGKKFEGLGIYKE